MSHSYESRGVSLSFTFSLSLTHTRTHIHTLLWRILHHADTMFAAYIMHLAALQYTVEVFLSLWHKVVHISHILLGKIARFQGFNACSQSLSFPRASGEQNKFFHDRVLKYLQYRALSLWIYLVIRQGPDFFPYFVQGVIRARWEDTPVSSYKSRSPIFVVFLAFRGFKMAGLHLDLLLASAETGRSNREGPASINL